jgi:hypothetical protein
LEKLLDEAQTEAKRSFGNGAVFLEKFVGRAKHIEVQVLADKHGKSTDEPVRVGSDSSARTAAGRVPKAGTHHRRPSSRIVRHYLTTSTKTGVKVSKKFLL